MREDGVARIDLPIVIEIVVRKSRVSVLAVASEKLSAIINQAIAIAVQCKEGISRS